MSNFLPQVPGLSAVTGLPASSGAGSGGEPPGPPEPGPSSLVWNTNTTVGSFTNSVQLKLPLVNGGTYNFTVNWGDGSEDVITTWNAACTTHTYATGGQKTTTINTNGVVRGWTFNQADQDTTKLETIAVWGPIELTAGTSAFNGCSNLKVTATDAPTINTTTFNSLFRDCVSLNSINLTYWNTAGVTSFSHLFRGCSTLTTITGFENLNTTSLNRLISTFQDCEVLNSVTLTSLNTNLVTNVSFCFSECRALNANVNSWNTANVTNFGSCFYNNNVFNWTHVKN